jgi:hypothetical protein
MKSEQVCCHGVGTSPPKSTFWVVSTAVINVGIQFVLTEQTDIAQVGECKKKCACCLHLSKLVLPFLGAEMMGCSEMSYLVSASFP